MGSFSFCVAKGSMVLAQALGLFTLGRDLRDALETLVVAFTEQWIISECNWPTAARQLALLHSRLCANFIDEDGLFRAGNATYRHIIDLLCQLEWLLQSLLLLQHPTLSAHSNGIVCNSAPSDQAPPTQFPDHLARQVTDFLKLIQPAMDTCRCIYAACAFSATARSKFLSNPTPVMDGAHRDQFLAHYNTCRGGSFSLQDLLERDNSLKKQSQPPFYTWPLALVDMLDLMLEIASIMRIAEECELPHGHLIPQNLCLCRAGDFGYHVKLRYEPTILCSAGNCYLAPELREFKAFQRRLVFSKNSLSHVYSYGSVCFNILTADVPGALKSTQTIQSRVKFYEFVRRGDWKQMVHGKPEYLVRLIAWCWETDPRKRPTFSTICSLLQRAMRCLIFPPVLNLTRLSNFLQKREYSLLNFYLSFVWSHDISCRVFGSGTLNEMVETFHHDTIEQQHFSSDFMCSKVMQAFAQIKAYRRMMGDPSNDEALTQEEDLACEIGELELGSLIELEKEFDSRSDTVLSSDVFEQHSIIFEAVAYDCMLASFPPLDYQFWIRPLINMSHHNQKLPIPLPNVPFGGYCHINHALLPHLICCWAGQTCSRGN